MIVGGFDMSEIMAENDECLCVAVRRMKSNFVIDLAEAGHQRFLSLRDLIGLEPRRFRSLCRRAHCYRGLSRTS